MSNNNHPTTDEALEQLIVGIGVTRLLEMISNYFKHDARIADPIKECILLVNENQKNYTHLDYGFRVGNRRKLGI